MTPVKQAKRHHYLPRFYLEGFSEERYLYVYDAKLGQLRLQTAVNTGLERYLYRHGNQAGDTVTLEKELSAIEGMTKAVIDAVDKRRDLSDEDVKTLAEFVSLMLVRVPIFDEEFRKLGDRLYKEAAKRTFSSEEATQEIMQRMGASRNSHLTPRKLFEFIQAERYSVVPDRDQAISNKMPIAKTLGRTLLGMQRLVTYSPAGQRFLTTDNPFTITFRPEFPVSFLGKPGPTSTDALLLIPLSQLSCLVINSQGLNGTVRASKRDAYEINLCIVRNSSRFVIGPERGLVHRLVKDLDLPVTPRSRRSRLLGLFRRTEQ